MNYSLFSADRACHLKIVLVSLAFSIVIVLAGINARSFDATTADPVLKAGQPVTYAKEGVSTVR